MYIKTNRLGHTEQEITFKTVAEAALQLPIGGVMVLKKLGTRSVNRGFILIKRNTERWVTYARKGLHYPRGRRFPETCVSLQLS